MRETQRRGNSRGRIRGTANLPVRHSRPGRQAAYLYRDRRIRRSRRRFCGLALLVLAAVIAAILILRPSVWRVAEPLPTATPTPEANLSSPPTPKPASTPTPVPGPTATPMTLTGPDVTEARPSLAISTQEDLIALLRWMIHDGTNIVKLDGITLSEEEIGAVMDQFSNYFEAYGFDAGNQRIGVKFKAGLKAMLALKAGEEDRLEGEERAVAEQARAVVDELIGDGMTDVEKELALHDYISTRCQYQDDGAGKNAQSALGFFIDGRCNCAGYVDTFRLLAGLAGLDVEMIGGPTTRDAPGGKGHAWNLVRLDGLWYAVDVTWDDMLGDAAAEHVFFNLPFSSFSGFRKTDSRFCPPGDYAASVDDKYYFNTPKHAAGTLEDALALATRQLDAGNSAYIYFTGEDLSYALNAALVQRYGGKLKVTELSRDLTLSVYRYAL